MHATRIADGVWPTMVTPFHTDRSIDFDALDVMIERFIESGVHGLFAVCQSSEMFFLDLDERVALARRCVESAAGRVPVIASGHVSETHDKQVEELSRIADTGIDGLVLVANRLALEDSTESGWITRFHRLIEAIPDGIALGFYECPYPNDLKLSDAMVRAIRDTGRFEFIKDTTCSISAMQRKIELLEGTGVKLFNANAATLLPSLRNGAAGYSGVMANFHPARYVELWERRNDTSQQTELLAAYLSTASLIERQYYPLNALYYMHLAGLPIEIASRRRDPADFTESMRSEVELFFQYDRSDAVTNAFRA